MERTGALHRALDQTEAIVDATTPEQLSCPTPCSQFDLRDLLNHTVASVQGLADAASRRGWDMSIYTQDALGKDPYGAFNAAAAQLREATASPLGGGQDVAHGAFRSKGPTRKFPSTSR
jgi:uncharacterized protein (TIGR03086 family)